MNLIGLCYRSYHEGVIEKNKVRVAELKQTMNEGNSERNLETVSIHLFSAVYGRSL